MSDRHPYFLLVTPSRSLLPRPRIRYRVLLKSFFNGQTIMHSQNYYDEANAERAAKQISEDTGIPIGLS